MPPSLAVAAIGIAIATHDGQAMLVAFVISALALAVAAWILL